MINEPFWTSNSLLKSAFGVLSIKQVFVIIFFLQIQRYLLSISTVYTPASVKSDASTVKAGDVNPASFLHLTTTAELKLSKTYWNLSTKTCVLESPRHGLFNELLDIHNGSLVIENGLIKDRGLVPRKRTWFGVPKKNNCYVLVISIKYIIDIIFVFNIVLLKSTLFRSIESTTIFIDSCYKQAIDATTVGLGS